MRLAMGLGAVLALTLTAGPASAFFDRDLNAPWCLAYSGTDGIVECSFYSFDQCMETRSGVGGSCQPNYNTRYAEEPRRRRRQRRH
jgi:Protein of unknown function (DUF3551)